MKKRALSVLLAMIMTLSFMPASAFAQPSAEQETTATTPPLLLSESLSVNNSETSGCVQIGSNTYDSLTEAVSAATAGDTLWLCDDDATVQQVTIDKSLTIELQGHELSSTALKITGSSTSVTINDRVGTGSINKNHAAGFSTDHNRCTATIVVADCATLTINGVTGTNSDTGTVVYDSATADLVKALFVQGASTLVINGGTFVAQQGAGRDALFVYDGTVTINDGYFLMNLSYLTAPTDAKPLTIKKCEIYNPSDSGAIWIQNSGTINGVSFNSGYQSLDNIRKLFLSTDAGNYLLSDSTKNHVKIGCGIYASSEISSTTLPDGTTYAVGSTNEDSPEQINPTTGSKITLAPQIAGGDGATITYTWEKDGSTLAGANGATYTIGSYSSSDDGSYKVTATEGNNSVSLYYQIGADAHTHCVCGGNITAGDHAKHTSATWTAWDGASDIEYTNGVASVYLSDSAAPSNALTVKDGNTLNLCLNGKTLSRSYTVIAVEGNATLNICDCMGGGEIVSLSGCAVSVTTKNDSNAHTTLNLYGGKVSSKSYSMLDPGAIKLYNNDANNAQTVAVFNMYGGEVCHEALTESAIYASYANIGTGYYQINMYGGNITCEKGNGFDFNNNQNVAMQVSGGTITSGWYGIWLSSQNALTLSGNPKFVDKAYYSGTANIYIPSNVTPTVTSDFAPADNTMISVEKSVDSSGSALIAKSAGDYSLTDKAQYFVSSEEGYFVECNTSGNLQLTACTITDQPTVDNSYTVTANGGSTDKVAYQWYKATSGKVAVTDKNATKAENFSYYSSSYGDEWFPNYNPMSADQVTLEAFTLHMAKDDVLTVKYQDSDHGEDNSQSRFDSFTLIRNGSEVSGTAGTESWYTTYTFVAPADGDYTLKATATPGTYEDSYGGSTRYNLFCDFSATVTADVAGDALSGQTAAALNTAELENDKYICGVTWEDKTTLYSNAVEFSAPVHTHCVCGKTDCSGDLHDVATKWTKWESENSLPSEAGNYYLDSSVTLSDTWNISSGVSINLCLNGKTIYGKSDNYEVIHVDGNLVITDCQGGGKITHDTSVKKAQGIRNYGTLTLWNGSITGNTSTDNGGGVWNTGAFNMYGGSITGNSAKRGGGVYNDISAAFTMTGGEISGNTASDYSGGGVHNEDQFNMTGGTISGNTAKGGGGVYTGNTVGTSVFTMSDTAIITGNSAEQGGGVLIVDGKFNMTGGSITKNWTTAGSYNYGGGVRIEENGKFNMTGGSITENTTNSSLGGGVYNDGTFNMSGNPQIAGNVMGGTIEDGALKTGTGTTNNVCLTNNEKIITVDTAGMDNTAKVGINVQDPEILPTVVTGSINTNVFSSDSADYKLVDNKEGGLKLANQEVTISGVTLLNEAEGAAMADSKKVYDGKAVAYEGGTYEPNVTGSLTYTWQVKEEGSETYANITDNIAPKDAGSYRLLVEFKRGDTVLGTENYDFAISKAELTIENLAVAGKDYDGNNTAAISSEPTLSGLVGDETVTLINGTPTFSSVSAGNGIDISFTDFSIEGDAAKNYTLTQPTGIKANITAAPLTITGATVTSKKYDGNNNATVSDVTFDGLKNGETLTINTDYTISNAKYDGVNATGEGAATKVDFDVALSDTTLANNYKLKTEKGTQDSQTIKKADTANKTSSTSGIRGQVNTFDMPEGFMVEGANIASITITQDANSIIARTPAYEDNTLTYELNSTAENGQTATTQLKITSQNYNDYYIDITVGVDEKQEIAITIDDATLTYNATPQAPTGITVENSVVPTSELVITYIGTDSTVYQESSTAPTDAGTYSMSVSVPDTNNKYKGTATKAFTIAPKEISATLKAENKTYDGSTSAQASATLTGVLASDADKVTATVTNPAFENKTADENKKVTANISLKGDAAGNYTVNTTAETTANITAKPLTINPLVIAEKHYDGTNKADFIATPKLVGVESDDEVILLNGVPTFSTVAVGRDIPINFTDFTLDGDDKDNYTLTQPTGITGDISAYIPFGLEYTTTTTDWTNQDFVVTAKSGWLVSETNTAEGTWSESLTRSAETGSDGDSLTFYVKNTNYGYISIAITKTYKIDKTVPVISGAEDNKTYCAAVTLTITDDNLESVSINGKAATPTESGTLTLEPAAGAQNVVATDKAGNSATLTVTVNDGHTWGAWTSNGNNTHSRTCALDATHTETASCHGGKATCTDKAVCDDCKLVYGELDPNNHADLKHVEAKAATTTTEGNIEYWYCTGCDKYFASESGQDEITEPDTVIKKLPVITKGDNAKVAQGTSEPLSFTSDADFADFLRVEVDGTILESKHYAVASGSTVVTLNANYVATLAAGEHVLGIVSQNGTATASFTVDKKAEEITPTPDKPTTNTSATTSPQTGDSAALFVWLTLLFVSGSAATITALAGRKRKNN